MGVVENRWVRVGRIGKPFGLKGEVVVHHYADAPDRFAAGARVFVILPEGRVEARVAQGRQFATKYVARFEGRDSVDAIRPWVGCEAEVRASELPPLEEGQFYHYQLLGLAVHRADGTRVGTIAQILGTGGNDVLRVCEGDREVLIPVIDDAIDRIDVAAGRVVLKDLEGLFEP
jgi:16S rRNA processing protein RimM